MHRRLARRSLLAVTAAGTCLGLATTMASPAQAATLPEGGLAQAAYNYAFSPNAVAGANDWDCKPTAQHPNPVVLLPGTFANLGANFVKTAPALKNAGYCVFATNFGMTWLSGGRVGGLDHAVTSGNQVAAFIDKVLSTTGAAKVDLVGHSQGGSMGINYVKLHGGAGKVAHYVGWGQSANGTSANGIVNLANAINGLGFVNSGLNLFAPGVKDQLVGSDYSKKLWASGHQLPAGPDYTTIQSQYDEVVTPYQTQSLQGAHNLVIQSYCPTDKVGHVGLFLDGPTLQLTLNALDDGPAGFKPSCTDFGPAV